MTKYVKKIVSMVMVAAMLVLLVPNTSYAGSPTLDTKFKVLRTGTNYIKTYKYNYNKDSLAGKFVAPETGKYRITVVNNGKVPFRANRLNRDLAAVESSGLLIGGETNRFATVYLRKNQVIYVHISPRYDVDDELIAARVIITKLSTAPKINKDTAIISRGGTTTLRVIGTTFKPVWVSGNSYIATVSSKGVVRGKRKGTTYIYAIVNHKLYECRVTVR